MNRKKSASWAVRRLSCPVCNLVSAPPISTIIPIYLKIDFVIAVQLSGTVCPVILGRQYKLSEMATLMSSVVRASNSHLDGHGFGVTWLQERINSHEERQCWVTHLAWRKKKHKARDQVSNLLIPNPKAALATPPMHPLQALHINTTVVWHCFLTCDWPLLSKPTWLTSSTFFVLEGLHVHRCF